MSYAFEHQRLRELKKDRNRDKVMNYSFSEEENEQQKENSVNLKRDDPIPAQKYLHLLKQFNDLNNEYIKLKNSGSSAQKLTTIQEKNPNGLGLGANTSASTSTGSNGIGNSAAGSGGGNSDSGNKSPMKNSQKEVDLLKSEIQELKLKNSTHIQTIMSLNRVLEYYDKNTSLKLPNELLHEIDNSNKRYQNELNSSNIGGNVMTQQQFEIEKQKLIAKHNEESRGYQTKVKQLLYLLRQEQLKFKEEQYKSTTRRALFKSGIDTDRPTIATTNTTILYSKEIVDELKQEIHNLTNKLKESEEKVQKLQDGGAMLKSIQQQQGQGNSPMNSTMRDYVSIEEFTNIMQKYNLTIEKLNATEKQVQTLEREKHLNTMNTSMSKSTNNPNSNDEIVLLKKRIQELMDNDQENKQKLKEAAKKIICLKEESNEYQKKVVDNLTNIVKLWMNEFRMLKSELGALAKMVLSQKESFFVTLNTIVENSLKKFLTTSNSEIFDIKFRYLKEMKERRRLFNLLQESKGNIRVFCRVRPLNLSENQSVVNVMSEYELSVKDPSTDSLKTFEYDAVFPPKSTQTDIFSEVKPLITSILDGYNVCIFAYGQTGSGKTYTMEGPCGDRGVYHRAIDELFKNIQDRTLSYEYKVHISLLEIYNEQIRDLFAEPNSARKLEIKQGQNGNYVPEAIWYSVNSPEEVQKYLELGTKNRAVGSTNLNEHSSRSHLIFTIMINGINHIEQTMFTSKLHLIDLAGSERLSKSKVFGDSQKESIFINKSLSAFGDVISARLNKNNHIPYRNSTLTYLLQDSLAGDSKILMILQISPSVTASEETITSLKFASRVMNVELGQVSKNVVRKK